MLYKPKLKMKKKTLHDLFFQVFLWVFYMLIKSLQIFCLWSVFFSILFNLVNHNDFDQMVLNLMRCQALGPRCEIRACLVIWTLFKSQIEYIFLLNLYFQKSSPERQTNLKGLGWPSGKWSQIFTIVGFKSWETHKNKSCSSLTLTPTLETEIAGKLLFNSISLNIWNFLNLFSLKQVFFYLTQINPCVIYYFLLKLTHLVNCIQLKW